MMRAEKIYHSISGVLRGLILPGKCPSCGASGAGAGELCGACYERYKREAREICPECGCTASFCGCGAGSAGHTSELAGGRKYAVLTFYKSRGDHPDPDRLTEKMIYALKATGAYADFFAGELAVMLEKLFAESGEDIHTWRTAYIPRTVLKKKDCGIDQSEELAVRLARRLGIPADSLFEREDGEEQKYLNRQNRTENMERSLRLVRKPKKDGKYLLVDDIITSGASMETAARILRFEGAAEIFPVAAARTMKKMTLK